MRYTLLMNRLMNVLRFLKDIYRQRKVWKFEKEKYQKYCSDSLLNRGSVVEYERNILILGHTLEKGLSHKTIKQKFGLDVANRLAFNLNMYASLSCCDDFILMNGISIFRQYIEANVKAGVRRDELPQLSEGLEAYAVSDVGSYLISGKEFFGNSKESFDRIAVSRRTVRLYDQQSQIITLDEIKECLEVAINSPSACNRQAVRVHIITDKEIIQYLCEIQGGSSGFGENAGALIIITSDLRYYTMKERRLPMYDCGLFSMSLLYAFYQKKIGCCILNGSFNEEQEDKIIKKISISSFEMISSFILLNKISDDDLIMVAKSQRKKVDEIIK